VGKRTNIGSGDPGLWGWQSAKSCSEGLGHASTLLLTARRRWGRKVLGMGRWNISRERGLLIEGNGRGGVFIQIKLARQGVRKN